VSNVAEDGVDVGVNGTTEVGVNANVEDDESRNEGVRIASLESRHLQRMTD